MINYDIVLIGTQFRIIAQNTVRVKSDPISNNIQPKICQKFWIFKVTLV